jgi:phosphopentomutase
MRAAILVMDSVGIGGAPDARVYGDDGADTVGHIARACAEGAADNGMRAGGLRLPNLTRLGLGNACRLATGNVPPGLENNRPAQALSGCAAELSRGKDTPSGHWEIAGVPVLFDWGYFPCSRPCFPPDFVAELCARAGLPGILGDCHASGTAIVVEMGEEHIRSGKPICYTSADSVFQIAAHEEAFGLEPLYAICAIARDLFDGGAYGKIGRVIARPFRGDKRTGFKRTANRRDYAVKPPSPTILDTAEAAKRGVITVGKIGDIFAHAGTGRVLKGDGNTALSARTLDGMNALADGGLLFANFIDFDTIHGHRRDTAGYAQALEEFDRWIPDFLDALKPGDLAIVTADHGCDPTWRGSDHTREQVPVIAFGPRIPAGNIGARKTFSDIAATVAHHLELGHTAFGSRFT